MRMAIDLRWRDILLLKEDWALYPPPFPSIARALYVRSYIVCILYV
jgi:hypothetical protein